MIHDASLDELLQQVWDGGRINELEARRLYELPLEELGALAERRRHLHRAGAHGGRGNDTVTYIVDRNVNYTNVCNVYCKFCAFWRAEKDNDSYVISFEEMDRKIEETIALGGTQILMQGGHHPKLTKQWYLDLLSHIKAKYPQVNIHGDRVRNRIAPLKADSAHWMGVMDAAHRLGLASSITMMFGHVETVEDRIEHLEFVRQQQDKSLARLPIEGGTPMQKAGAFAAAVESGKLNGGAFTAFICWTFQPENAVLKAPTVGAHEYLRVQALGRIYLDNIPSVQSSWVTQGPDIGQVALKYGANDLGSIMIEENVVSAAGATFRMGVADMKRLIEDIGYEPRQRDNWYRLLN